MHPEPLSSKASHTTNYMCCPCILSNNSRHKDESLDETYLRQMAPYGSNFLLDFGDFRKKQLGSKCCKKENKSVISFLK